MSTHGFEDCIPGSFYGFDTKLHPGNTPDLQWGGLGKGNPLNITLARHGGELLHQIAGNARFSPTNDTFRLVVNETANCTLEQYTWAIPPGFDTSSPEYQIGLFDATVDSGAFGNPLAGWIVWSPLFYVRELMSDTTTTSSSSVSETATATAPAATSSTSSTALLTGTGTGKLAPTPTPTATSSSPPETGNGSSDASDIQIGVGVGVGVGGFLLVLLLGWFLLRRRKRTRQNQPEITPPPPMSTAHAELDANEIVQAPGETKGGNVYEMPG